MLPRKHSNSLRAGLLALLLILAGCGSGTQSLNSGKMSGLAAVRNDASAPRVASVTLSPGKVTGGASTALAVELASAAPSGGVSVQLQSSNANVAVAPVSVHIPAGETSATALISTSAVTASTTVSLTALVGDSVSGASLQVAQATASAVTVTLQPSTVTLEPGTSSSFTVKTTVASGFDHSLALTAPVAQGLKMSFSPSTIAAPGSGSSTATISVGKYVTGSGYQYIHVTASEGTVSSSTTFTLKIDATPNPGASFQGCWYTTGGQSYQAVQVSVTNPGTYPFDGDLYYGTNCNPNTQADEIGFGTPIGFGGFDWIFYFNAFADQKDMSTLWHVGKDTSQCVNYEVAPPCQ